MNRNVFFALIATGLLCAVSAQDVSTGISIETEMPGVKVSIDGKTAGITQFNELRKSNILRIPLRQGTYRVSCELAGFTPWSENIIIGPNDIGFRPFRVSFRKVSDTAESLSKQEGVSRSKVGTLIVRSDPDRAYVSVDGNRQTELTDCKISTAVGMKRVEVFFPSRKLSIEFELMPDETLTIFADFEVKNEITVNKNYKVRVSSDPKGASLIVDGAKMGQTPVTVEMSHGEHTVRVESPGYAPYEKKMLVRSNDIVEAKLGDLARHLVVGTSPSGADVYVNEAYVGKSPVRHQVGPGAYSVKAILDDYVTYVSDTIKVELGKTDAEKAVDLPMRLKAAKVSFIRDKDYSPGEPIRIAGKTVGYANVSANEIHVPVGRQICTVGKHVFEYEFREGDAYSISASFPYQINSTIYNNPDMVPGAKKYPPKPKMLDESKTVYAEMPNFGSGAALQAMMVGFSVGGGGGWILSGISQMSDPSASSDGGFSGFLMGGLIGSAVGWFIGAVINPKKVPSGREPYTENINKNRAATAAWEKETSEVKQYNANLMKSLNDKANAETAKLQAANNSRGYVEVKNLKTGSADRIRMK